MNDLAETTADAMKHPELAPCSEGSFTLAALISSGIAGALAPRNDTHASYMLHRAAMVRGAGGALQGPKAGTACSVLASRSRGWH